MCITLTIIKSIQQRNAVGLIGHRLSTPPITTVESILESDWLVWNLDQAGTLQKKGVKRLNLRKKVPSDK